MVRKIKNNGEKIVLVCFKIFLQFGIKKGEPKLLQKVGTKMKKGDFLLVLLHQEKREFSLNMIIF